MRAQQSGPELGNLIEPRRGRGRGLDEDTTQPTPNVHQPLYQPQPQPDSPTHTDILGFTDDRQINVLSKEFVLDKELLKHDYLKPENSDRKNQFLQNIMNTKEII